MQTFGVWEAAEGVRFDCVVFFPSLSRGREIIREGWRLQAGEGARPLPGLYPVILFSHDAASSRFANSDAGAALAGNGFIVIAPTHAGDNQDNSDGLHTADLLLARPRQILLALETVLASPVFAPYADESRIGLLGVGFGSVTALQLAGVRPDPGRMEAYCAHAAKSPSSSSDPFCTPWARARIARLSAEAALLEARWGDKAFIPSLDFYAPSLAPAPAFPADSRRETPQEARPGPSLWDRLLAYFSLSGSPEAPPAPEISPAEPSLNATMPILIPDFDGGPLFGTDDPRLPYAYLVVPDSFPAPVDGEDGLSIAEAPSPAGPALENKPVIYRRPAAVRRIRALALLAPAGGMLFPRDDPAGSRIPALIIEAGADGLYAPERHSRPYLSLLSPQTRVARLAEADHFSLFSPCSDEARESLADVCGRIKEEERQDIRDRRDGELISFFQSALGFPLDPAPPSGLVAVDRPVVEKKAPDPPEAGSDDSGIGLKLSPVPSRRQRGSARP
jgi:predicted dienelactone hydrolase